MHLQLFQQQHANITGVMLHTVILPEHVHMQILSIAIPRLETEANEEVAEPEVPLVATGGAKSKSKTVYLSL